MSGPQGSDPTLPWPTEPEPGQGQPPASPPPADPAPRHQQPPSPPQYEPQPSSPPHYQQPPPAQYQQPPAPPYSPQQQYPPTAQAGPPPGYSPTAQMHPGPYGQPAPHEQPSQSGTRGAPESGGGAKRSLALIGGVAAVLVVLIAAVVGVLGFWKPGFFRTTELNVNSAQSGIQQVLTDEATGYGAKDVSNVKCNNGQNPTVKKGDTFTCEVNIDGTKRQVTVTFRDDEGTYEVSRPK